MGTKTFTIVAAAFVVAACSSSSSSSTNGDAGSSTSGQITSVTSACTFDPSLAGADGGRDVCNPSRVLVECTSDSGSGAICPSTGPIDCAGVDPSGCVDDCQENEYVVVCGGIGAGAVPDPPSACHSAGANPGGFAYYCCPCQ